MLFEIVPLKYHHKRFRKTGFLQNNQQHITKIYLLRHISEQSYQPDHQYYFFYTYPMCQPVAIKMRAEDYFC